MDYFANESQVLRVGDFELTNRTDRITIGGGDITRDEDGLKTLRALAEQLRQIEAALTVDRDKGQLPKKIAIKADTSEANPFN